MKELIRKHALANAVEHNGKANENAVLGRVLAESPNLKKDISNIKKKISETVKEVNKLSVEKQREELKKTGYEKIEKEQREGLPELPEAKIGKVVTRFAPEPNGYIHLGHLKSAFLSFLYAKKYKGKMFLRFDDTNPDKERKEYYNAIREDLAKFGITYHKEIRESDFMEEFYKNAEQLINQGSFYVCLCSQEQIGKSREEGLACGHRNQSKEENLKLWKKMLKTGKEGEMIVRFKTEVSNPNPALRDPGVLRVVGTSHPLLGSKYRVYPMYNFASVIVDHALGTTHILRDKGFENDAVIQERLFNTLGWNAPVAVQFGRIKTAAGIPMKKRKIQEMIDNGQLSGFDDLRIPNPRNLLKRGFRPEALKRLMEEIGPSKNDIDISMETIEAYNRQIIDKESNRYFFVGDPVEINLDRLVEKKVKAPLYPGKRKYRNIPVTKKLFVDKLDFTQYRGKEVRLMHFCNVILDRNARVTGKPVKDIPKIHWVPQKSVKIKLIMPDRNVIDGLAEDEIKNIKANETVQFERLGFARHDSKGVFYFAHK